MSDTDFLFILASPNLSSEILIQPFPSACRYVPGPGGPGVHLGPAMTLNRWIASSDPKLSESTDTSKTLLRDTGRSSNARSTVCVMRIGAFKGALNFCRDSAHRSVSHEHKGTEGKQPSRKDVAHFAVSLYPPSTCLSMS
jgi:hypothetical protein